MPEQTVGYVKEVIDSGTCYVLFVLMAIWGGTAAYVSRLKRSGALFSLVELIGEWSISGFSGLVTALICHAYHVDFFITSAAVGISGHMGGRLIFLIERGGQKFIESRLGFKIDSVDE